MDDAIPAVAAGVPAAIPVAFSFEPFNAATAKFDRWLKRLDISFRIFKVSVEDKRDYLLHYMGSATYDVLCNKLKNDPPHTKTYEEIVALLKTHFSPAPLEILENVKFNSRKQKDNESLSDYIMNLEKMAQTCNFGAHLDSALRNQFVFGIQKQEIQSRLLEVRNLTLARAKEIAFGMEMSLRGTDEMHGAVSQPQVQHIEHGKKKKKKMFRPPTEKQGNTSNSSGPSCYRCGDRNHFANKCKHQNTTCNHCRKKGHLEKVCQSKINAKKEKRMHITSRTCLS
ncbi:uncharacterized protein LOC128739957 [Sabethes cyaneus]|uniref:uncharacterized protein LOC128739957 n=1 Tax=Sabethes cyaneus TaxID=53552 RepID=UPI00237ECADD|nr:uncharacterized protein LOC128739957 [Sabethes cyaneus]